MPVYERSYRRWDGELERRGLRFLPITTAGVRSALGAKRGWFLTLLLYLFMLVSVVPTLIVFFANYAVAYRPALLRGGVIAFLDSIAPFRVLQYPLLTRINVYFVMVYAALFGSGLIAKDRGSGALPLYLSRPLTLADYVLGKLGVIVWFGAMFTLVPNLLLWLFAGLTDESGHALHDSLATLGPIVAQNLAVVATYSLTILAASSLCRRPMYAGLIWFGTVIMLPTITGAIGGHLGLGWLHALSPNQALFAVAYDLFDGTALAERAGRASDHGVALFVDGVLRFVHPFRATPIAAAWLSLAGWCGFSLALMLTMLRRQDVVGDSGTRR